MRPNNAYKIKFFVRNIIISLNSTIMIYKQSRRSLQLSACSILNINNRILNSCMNDLG